MRMPVPIQPPAATKTATKPSRFLFGTATILDVALGHKDVQNNVDCEGDMPCWYFDKHQLRDTPSIRDGIPFETERRYRKEGARFIMSCGTQMGLGHNTMATGVVYFHRFYMFHSFKNFPRYVTACCCLFLAGKVEETPKKCRDIIRTARTLLSDNYFYSFGEDPKEEVMTLERILLQTIKFDLQVEHPYTFLLKYVKCFKGDQQKLQKLLQMAWNFVNDSLSTVVSLQWEPEIIAVALIHLASKLSKFTVVDWNGKQPGHTRWWDMFVAEVTMDILEDICHQVLDLYQNNPKEANGPPSPPQLPPSRAELPKPPPPKVRTNSGSTGMSPVRKSAKQMHSSGIGVNVATIAGLPATHASGPAGSIAVVPPHHQQQQIHNLNSTSNHIQPIRSITNSAPIPTAIDAVHNSLSSGAASTSSSASLSSSTSTSGYHQIPHHLYRAPLPTNSTQHPQQIHAMYGSTSSTTAPPPPPPPSHSGYGSGNSNLGASHLPPLPPAPYSSNVWAPTLPSSSHYQSNLPPMPPPSATSSHGHMGQQPPPQSHSSSGGYYHHHQPQHHQRHYGRQQRY